MDVSLLLRVAGIGILVTVTCQVLSRAGRDDQSMLLSLLGVVLVLFFLVEQVGELINTVRTVFGI